jgi:hypothetical protein
LGIWALDEPEDTVPDDKGLIVLILVIYFEIWAEDVLHPSHLSLTWVIFSEVSEGIQEVHVQHILNQ